MQQPVFMEEEEYFWFFVFFQVIHAHDKNSNSIKGWTMKASPPPPPAPQCSFSLKRASILI